MASGTDPETLRREVVGADGLIIRTGGTVDAALLDCGKDLKVVGRHGVGYDAIDVDAATGAGHPGRLHAGGEHAERRRARLRHDDRPLEALPPDGQGRRARSTSTPGPGTPAATSSAGPSAIIGFGRIGRRVGRHGQGGVRDARALQRHRRRPRRGRSARPGRRGSRSKRCLKRSEYVTLHVPLDPSTRGMIDREAVALMRPDAILINACRGPVVVESAVAEALAAGKLWGYGADVFEHEPDLAGNPLIGRDDVMLTPHSAAQTEEGLSNMARGVAEDVLGVLRGDRPLNPVNDPEAVEASRRRLGLAPLYRG